MRAILQTDIVGVLLFVTIIDANVRHLRETPELDERYSGLHDVPPDEVRRPLSVYALSKELGLPYETTRRQVNKLIAQGLCERAANGGLIVPYAQFEREDLKAHTDWSWGELNELVRDLKASGADFGA
jgi:hypothetical protein